MNDVRRRWRDLVRGYALHYDAPANDRYWAPEFETCPRDRLREIQSEKLSLARRSRKGASSSLTCHSHEKKPLSLH